MDPKPRKSRTKSGCLCCRLRRKKCDERKPLCKGCERNHLICSWSTQPSVTASNKTSDLGWRIDLQSGKSSLVKATTSAAQADEEPISVHIKLDGQASMSPAQLLVELQYRLRLRFPENVHELSPWSSNTKLLDDDRSRFLLDHFVSDTAPLLVGTSAKKNPLLTLVVPRTTSSNSPALDAILALSGAHFGHSNGSSAMKATSMFHYVQAIKKLKISITEWNSDTAMSQQTLDLLVAAILLYQYEAVVGNAETTAYHHVRASRELIVSVLSSQGTNNQDKDLLGFLMEFYAYLTIVGSLTNIYPERRSVLMSDWFVHSLGHLTRYRTFGSMFGCSSQLYEWIVYICMLHNNRTTSDQEAFHIYQEVENRISLWTPEPSPLCYSPQERSEVVVSSYIYQRAILIFLQSWYSRYYGPPPQLPDKIDAYVTQAIEWIQIISSGAPIVTTLLWPLLIIGASAKSEVHRNIFRIGLQQSHFSFPQTEGAVNILEQVWALQTHNTDSLMILEQVLERNAFAMS